LEKPVEIHMEADTWQNVVSQVPEAKRDSLISGGGTTRWPLEKDKLSSILPQLHLTPYIS
jgi:hypothetical protein